MHGCVSGCMHDAWVMHGWIGTWVHAWMLVCMDACVGACMDSWVDTWMDACVDVWWMHTWMKTGWQLWTMASSPAETKHVMHSSLHSCMCPFPAQSMPVDPCCRPQSLLTMVLRAGVELPGQQGLTGLCSVQLRCHSSASPTGPSAPQLGVSQKCSQPSSPLSPLFFLYLPSPGTSRPQRGKGKWRGMQSRFWVLTKDASSQPQSSAA